MSTIAVNNINHSNRQLHESIHQNKNSVLARKVHSFLIRTISEFRDNLWNLINPPWQIIRRGVHISAKILPHFSPKLLRVFYGMGLTMGLNALLTLSKYPASIKSLIKNLELKDIEGVISASIGLLINPLDALDSTITFANSLAEFGVVPVISIFSMISLPLALVLLGYGTVKGTYDSVRLGMEMGSIPKSVSADDLHSLKIQLESKLQISRNRRIAIEERYKDRPEKIHKNIEVVKSRHVSKLNRRSDQKTVSLMSEILKTLKNNNDSLGLVNDQLNRLHSLMKRKIVVGCIGNIANLCLGTVLAATYISPVSAIFISTVILLKNSITLCKTIYLNRFYNKL